MKKIIIDSAEAEKKSKYAMVGDVKLKISTSKVPSYVGTYLDQLGAPFIKKEIFIGDERVGDYTNEDWDFLVEKKTMDDYYKSCLDGSILDQLERMSRLYDGPKYLIFEGDWDTLVDRCMAVGKGVYSRIRSIRIRCAAFNTTFWMCCDTLETAKFIIELNLLAHGNKEIDIPFLTIKIKEKDQRLKPLLTVEKIGIKKAKLILKKCGSLERTIWCSKHKPDELTSILSIGPKIVENIYNMFHSKEAVYKRGSKPNKVYYRTKSKKFHI